MPTLTKLAPTIACASDVHVGCAMRDAAVAREFMKACADKRLAGSYGPLVAHRGERI